MTLIVGATQNGRVMLGADSLTSTAEGNAIRTTPKIFRSGPLLMGVAGSPRVSDVLRYAGPQPFMDLNQDAHQLIVQAFVPWLHGIASENHVLMSYEGQDVLQGHSRILIGFRGALFCVGYDFSTVTYACGYAAIGSAAPYALGALHAVWNNPEYELDARVSLALNAALAHSPDVQGPRAFLELGEPDSVEGVAV